MKRIVVASCLIGLLAVGLSARAQTGGGNGSGNTSGATLTPEMRTILADYGREISGIPNSAKANYGNLINYIQSNSQSFGEASSDPQFHQAVSKLLGIRQEMIDNTRGGGGGTTPSGTPGNPGRTAYEEQYYRGLQGALPGQYWVHREAGKYAFDRKDYQTALKDYEAAIRLNPRDTKSLLGYGLSATELGDFALGNKAANQLLEYDPRNRDALGLRAFSTGRRSTVNLPSSLFEPAAGDSGQELALGVQSGAPGARYAAPAGTSARAVVDRAAIDRSAQLTREAVAAMRVRDFAVAHQLASRAVQANPQNAQALNFRAIASNRLTRYQDAVTDASAALALVPGNAPALQTRSWAFAKQKQYKEALADANATIEADPNNAFAYQNRAYAQAGLGDREGSIDSLRRSAALDARFQTRLERALQLPQDQDLTLLFDDESAATATVAPAPAPGTAKKRFARLALLSASGGLLIALGVLHVVSASWREKVRMTIRRALASPGEDDGSVDVPSAPLPAGGAFWTQYELSREIGLGGMGVVYEATDRALERRVAVKKMRDEIRLDPHERQRFVNEARVVAQLRHPNIVDIYGIVEEGQDVYLVFEFVDGKTLHDVLRSSGPLDLTNARGVLKLMSDAVEHAHAKKVIHRDIKPSNVMITTDGRVKVMDFGIARQAKDAVTKMSMTNTIAGTPPYMAPEQEQGTVRRESDVYALGVCFYEMITGQLPFSGTGAAMLLNKLNGKYVLPTQRNPALPQALDAVMAQALHPDPDKRYHTPAELVAAVEAAAEAARA